MGAHVDILDTTLRDGSYAIDFQFTAEDTALVASALESAGIRLIEVAHGLGLGAAAAGKGDQADTDEAYLRAAAGVLTKARFGAFFIPGIGQEDGLRLAAGCGMHFVRIGTNINELTQAAPYISLAKQMGFQVFCNLMKSYAVGPTEFGACAKRAQEMGADIAVLVDSAGGMLPEEVRAYIEAARSACDVRLGFHGHDNLCMGVANALEASAAGATVIDASLQGMGRSEGNTVTEVLVAVLQKRGLLEGIDVNALLDVGEAFIRPLMHEQHRTAIGITTGRARFHSSFLGRASKAAAQFDIDVRDLILGLGARNQIDAPQELIEAVAKELAEALPRPPMRVDIAATQADVPAGFEEEVRERAKELKEKSRKMGVESILNIVVTRYEMTRVSPFVETNFRCALSTVMLAEAGLLENLLREVDGLVDYVLLDPGGQPAPKGVLRESVLLTYSDHKMWARACAIHLNMLIEGGSDGKTAALTGIAPLAIRAAVALAEMGAIVYMDSQLEAEAQAAQLLAPGISARPLAEIAGEVDAVISLSPRKPSIGPDIVALMRPGAILYDGGIGSLDPAAVPEAERRGVRVVRVDSRPSLAASALELLGMRRMVTEYMGREIWNGVSVVAGGLIAREGEVIVDSIRRPTRVIGIGDGRGGIYRPEPDNPSVRTVRRAIAAKRLDRRQL